MNDTDPARSMAEKVSVWIELDDESYQPVVLFENSGDSPVYSLAVFCFHFAAVLSGSYPVEEPQHGRKALTKFTDALAQRYRGDDGGEMARQAQFVAGFAFLDATDRWWCRRADGTLVEANDGEEAGRWAFLSAPRDRSGPQLWTVVT